MNQFQMEESPWQEFDQRDRDSLIVIIPIGAVEVYGKHMPMGSDGIAVKSISRKLCESTDLNIMGGPLVPIGFSRHLQTFPGTLSVSTASLKGYLKDFANSLVKWGCKKLVFFNGHLGNVPPVTELMFELFDENEVSSIQIDLWRFIQPISEDLLESESLKYGHAGEAMTSVFLYLHPEMVRKNEMLDQPERKVKYPEGVTGIRDFRKSSNEGVLGFSTKASPEKGEKIVSRTIAELEKTIKDAFPDHN